jgi:hypothetical protein
MSKKILDTLTIYGLDTIPDQIIVNNKQFQPKQRPNTQIIDVIGLGLSMSQSYTLTWTKSSQSSVILRTEFKYRVDCHPEPSKEKSNRNSI